MGEITDQKTVTSASALLAEFSGLTYDGEGNPTSYSGYAMVFDPENHLTSFTQSGTTHSYTYNGDDQCVSAFQTGATSPTYSIYDGDYPFLQLASDGSVASVSDFGANGLFSKDGHFYLWDPSGNACQRLTSTGTVEYTRYVDAFGQCPAPIAYEIAFTDRIIAEMIPIPDLPDVASGECLDIVKMADDATRFLNQWNWCSSITSGYLDRGLPGVVAIFYFEFVPSGPDVDSEVWVIVGDIPPSYIDVPSCPDGITALEAYLFCLQEWVDAVNTGTPLDGLMPVYYGNGIDTLQPTLENAAMVGSRIATLKNEILPWLKEWTVADLQEED